MESENFFKAETPNAIAPESTEQPKTQFTEDYTVNKSVRDDDVSKKSRLAALLLGIFLSGYGAHNFYLGRYKRAVAQLLLTIISFIIILKFFVGEVISLAVNAESISEEEALASSLKMFGGMLFCYIPLIVNSIWGFIEWVMIAAGVAKDGNGKKVTNW
jgi:TM2 domain-containing membrane protein YozV